MNVFSFNRLLILFFVSVIGLRIVGKFRLAGIPSSYYPWLLFSISFVGRHVLGRRRIPAAPVFRVWTVFVAFSLVNFLVHDFKTSEFPIRLGVFSFYTATPLIISYRIGAQNRRPYLAMYHRFILSLAAAFIVMLLTRITPEGFYLSGANRNAVVFLMTPTLCYFWALRREHSVYPSLVLSIAVLFCYSRAAFVLLAVIFLYELYCYRSPQPTGANYSIALMVRKLRIPTIAGALGIGFAIALLSTQLPILRHKLKKMEVVTSGRLLRGDVGSEEGDYRRSRLMRQAEDMFLESPWIGMGFGSTFDYLRSIGVSPRYIAQAHSLYLTLLAENGILGTALVVLLFWMLYRMSIRIPVFAHPCRLSFLSMAAISVGNEYVITAPWFSVWLGFVVLVPQWLKRSGHSLDELNRFYADQLARERQRPLLSRITGFPYR